MGCFLPGQGLPPCCAEPALMHSVTAPWLLGSNCILSSEVITQPSGSYRLAPWALSPLCLCSGCLSHTACLPPHQRPPPFSSILDHSTEAQTSHLQGRFHLGIGLGPREAQQPCTGRSQSTAADCQVRHCTSFKLVKTDCSVPGRTDS